MNRYKLVISYDGTAYSGWQVQSNALAIQQILQKALETSLDHPIHLTGSGRTDAGVHAIGQTAHFDTHESLDVCELPLLLNALLPSDIRILSITPVASDFHVRYDATSKIYHYHLHLDPIACPLTRLYRYHIGTQNCDLTRLKAAISHFLGKHNFRSFANAPDYGSASRDPIRTLLRLDCISEPGGVRLEFEADGFLYKMVRNITGTLLDVAAKRMEPDDIPFILNAKDRRRAGTAAPPHGLFLVQVNY